MSGTQIGYIIGAVLGFIVALVIAPLFPAPAAVVVMWLGYVVAVLCIVLLLVSFVSPGTSFRRRT